MRIPIREKPMPPQLPVTMAVGTAQRAREFLDAARLQDLDQAPPSMVVYLLLGHALELAFKAVIIAHGTTEKVLAKTIRHNLRKAADRAVDVAPAGVILLDDADRARLDLLSGYYRSKGFEYVEPGFVTLPIARELLELAETLTTAISTYVQDYVRRWIREDERKSIHEAAHAVQAYLNGLGVHRATLDPEPRVRTRAQHALDNAGVNLADPPPREMKRLGTFYPRDIEVRVAGALGNFRVDCNEGQVPDIGTVKNLAECDYEAALHESRLLDWDLHRLDRVVDKVWRETMTSERWNTVEKLATLLRDKRSLDGESVHRFLAGEGLAAGNRFRA